MRRFDGKAYPGIAMRQEALGLADAETHLDAFRALPTRLIVLDADAKDYGLDIENLRTSPAVEILSRPQLIEEAQSDAWMVF